MGTPSMPDLSVNVKQLKADLIRDEGVRQFPYTDSVNKCTIGVGRNLTDIGLNDDEISFLLSTDINVVVANIQQYLPWVAEHPEPVQRALANLCFNIGINGLLGFKNSLDLVKQKKYSEAADNFLKSKWAAQVKSRATRVTDLLRSAV